jgi:glycosyltransferase involved in cell wall biosynthesis
VRTIDALLRAPQHAEDIGRAARERVLASYSWQAHLAGLDRYLESASPALGAAA